MIELLVVISIVALLIALLLPTIKRARETARTVKCASNLRQGMLAMRAYTHDHKEYLPHKAFPPAPTNRGAWAWNLSPYLGVHGSHTTSGPLQIEGRAFGLEYMRCPSAVATEITGAWWECTYGAHYGPGPAAPGQPRILVPFYLDEPQRIYEIPDYFVIADSNASGFPSPTTYDWSSVWGPWVASPKEIWRHLQFYNFAYKDGHVKKVALDWFLDNPGKVPNQ